MATSIPMNEIRPCQAQEDPEDAQETSQIIENQRYFF